MTEKRYRAFENIQLKQLCETLAKENNLKLIWKPKNNYKHKMLYQINKTDAEFLLEQCNRSVGFKLKISNDKIIIYEDSITNSGLKLNADNMNKYDFTAKTFGTYKKCVVKFFNAETGEVVEYQEVDDKIRTDSVLIVEEQALSSEEAKRIAKAKLMDANAKEITAYISIMGNPSIWTGYELNISDVGVFDGTYIIDKVTHSINATGGYTTNLNCYLRK